MDICFTKFEVLCYFLQILEIETDLLKYFLKESYGLALVTINLNLCN